MMHRGHLRRPAFLFLFLTAVLTGEGQDSANIEKLDQWQDPSLPSSTFFNNTYNEVWGFVQGGKEYAVIGSTMGTHIFDVSDPSNIQQVDMVPGAHQGSDIVHRDYHDHRGHLFMVSDEGSSTLQIADLSSLPDSVTKVYDSDNLFTTAHNIFIDSSSSLLYACGARKTNNSQVDLMILDVSTPQSPSKIRDYGATHYFHDIYVRNDTAYGNHGDQAGLIVYDMADPNNINVIGTLPTYSDQGYNHSGWLGPSGDRYVMADETHGERMKLLDVSDLSNIQEISLFLSGVHDSSIAHNPIIHGEHVYVGHYHDGLNIWNISDPSDPVRTGFYDTFSPNDHSSYKGNWGVYPFLPSGILLASDMQSGLYVFNVDSAESSLALEEERSGMPSVRIHPNPARKKLELEFSKAQEGPVEARVIDLRGRTRLVEEWNGAKPHKVLDIGGLKRNGVHLLELRSPHGKVTKKFMKVK